MGAEAATLGKWQWIRLVDIFFLGPFMMLLAAEMKHFCTTKISNWQPYVLYFFGLTTILVNLYFYIKIATL